MCAQARQLTVCMGEEVDACSRWMCPMSFLFSAYQAPLLLVKEMWDGVGFGEGCGAEGAITIFQLRAHVAISRT